MSVIVQNKEGGRVRVIKVVGDFRFDVHEDFREAYASNRPGDEVIIDMAETVSLDSSGLGMLLMLRDHLGGDTAQIKVVNPGPEIERVLAIANFDKLFTIQ